ALAVADAFRGKGLGTLLLERLALVAVRSGFTRFWAVTSADNRAMLDVFRASGFEGRGRADRGGTGASLVPVFRPNGVAVVGALCEPAAIGRRVLDGLLQTGFRGPVYPVNPRAAEIAGLKAYPSVRDVPEPVDLAVIAVPAGAVAGVVDDCAARGVRALVVISAGFAEAGGDGVALQQALVEKVRGHGMRMVGPNCLGLLNAD